MLLIILTLIFVLMLLLPLLAGVVTFEKNDSKTLFVNPDRSKPPRYFAYAFATMFDEKWLEYDGSGTILFSRPENIIEADKAKAYPKICESMVIAEHHDFIPPTTGIHFHKEIYAKKNAYLYGVNQFQAIFCRENMILGENTEITRWADAQGALTVLDHSNLGISFTSGTELVIGNHCTFRRLYAPIIYLGQTPDKKIDPLEGKDPRIYHMVPRENQKRNIEYVDSSLVNAMGVAEFSVVSKNEVTVPENVILQGNIRSHKGIRIGDNAVVIGSLFAEENIVLGKNVCVLGPIFTQGNIMAKDKAVIGQERKIISVIARGKIWFEGNSIVYGNISCEEGMTNC